MRTVIFLVRLVIGAGLGVADRDLLFDFGGGDYCISDIALLLTQRGDPLGLLTGHELRSGNAVAQLRFGHVAAQLLFEAQLRKAHRSYALLV